MEQSLADGGNTKLVAQLKFPTSQDQLKANLATVSAQIQTARVDKKQPNLQKMESLSSAVSEVIQKDPSIPIAWEAVAQLVSYRSEALHPKEEHLPSCDLKNLIPEMRTKIADGSDSSRPHP